MDFNKIIGHEDIISRFRSSIELEQVSHAYIIGGEKEVDEVRLLIVLRRLFSVRVGVSES